MSEDELTAIEARALVASAWNADNPRFIAWARDAADEVHALIAEVRRLRAEADAASVEIRQLHLARRAAK